MHISIVGSINQEIIKEHHRGEQGKALA